MLAIRRGEINKAKKVHPPTSTVDLTMGLLLTHSQPRVILTSFSFTSFTHYLVGQMFSSVSHYISLITVFHMPGSPLVVLANPTTEDSIFG